MINKFFLLLCVLFIAPFSSAKATHISLDIHSKCTESRDYKGCVDAHSGSSSALQKSDETCFEDGKWCIAQKGIDRTGLPKRVGWLYTEENNSIVYYSRTHKIKHKGGYGRYVGNYYKYHYYDAGATGTAPIQTSIGMAQTRCDTWGGFGTITCQTRPAPVITIPGRQGRQPGYRTSQGFLVYDCVDKTRGTYQNGKLIGNWQKFNPDSIGPEKCADIKKRPAMDVNI